LLFKPLSVETNDGTTCIYYPNGQLAVLVSNVFGYSAEIRSQSPISGFSAPINNAPTQFDAPSVNSFGGGVAIGSLMLSGQNLIDSYSTVIYDSSTAPLLNPDNQQRITSTIKKKFGRLLAIITSTGCCVHYRSNGNPYFVCTETGGYLCTANNTVYYQWKWTDLSTATTADDKHLKDKLNIDLNDFIRLEYHNPFDIQLIYKYEKDKRHLSIGCHKPNVNRLNNDLLNRIISVAPSIKSKTGQLKLIPNSKPNIIQQYKQYHIQQRELKDQRQLTTVTFI
jgi:hypothetical protein